MNIPGDTGYYWRHEKLIEYVSKFPDEIGPVVKDFLKARNASKSDVVWWVLLYSSCYCMGTACVLYDCLDYKTITKRELREFWENNKQRLIFQSDRRYIKNMNQFCDIVKEFIKRSKRKPWNYISQFIHDDPTDTYKELYKEVSSWKYYGRFGTILFMYNLNKLMSIDMYSETYDWKKGATTTSALYNAMYEDEKADLFDKQRKIAPKEQKYFDQYLNQIIGELKEIAPKKRWTIMGVTSDLCSYRKLFKQSRYLGYYVDRQQEELLFLEKSWPEKDFWGELWQYRRKYVPDEYLGELNGWEGIQKERLTAWVDKGEFR